MGQQIKSLLTVFACHFFLGLADVLHVQKRLFDSSAPDRKYRDVRRVARVDKGGGRGGFTCRTPLYSCRLPSTKLCENRDSSPSRGTTHRNCQRVSTKSANLAAAEALGTEAHLTLLKPQGQSRPPSLFAKGFEKWTARNQASKPATKKHDWNKTEWGVPKRLNEWCGCVWGGQREKSTLSR